MRAKIRLALPILLLVLTAGNQQDLLAPALQQKKLERELLGVIANTIETRGTPLPERIPATIMASLHQPHSVIDNKAAMAKRIFADVGIDSASLRDALRALGANGAQRHRASAKDALSRFSRLRSELANLETPECATDLLLQEIVDEGPDRHVLSCGQTLYRQGIPAEITSDFMQSPMPLLPRGPMDRSAVPRW